MLNRTLTLIKTFFSDLLSMDLVSLDSRRRKLIYFIQLVSHVFIQYQKDLGLQMSAALAYTTVLSLVPVSALLVLYTKIAGKLDNYSSSLQGWVLQTFVADSAHGVIDYVNSFIDNIQTRTLGTVGIAGLLFSTYTTFKTVEKAFNHIWVVKKSRSSWATIQILCSLLILVPALLASSFYISGKFSLIHSTMKTFSIFVPLLMTSLSLIFLFKLVPNTNVHWKSAIISGFIAAAVFETAKWGFNIYVTEVLPVSKIYGSLGLVPVFLIWIYFSWSIVLLGVELSFTLQNLHLLREERRQKEQGRQAKLRVHEEWGFIILEALASIHLKMLKPVLFDELRKELSIEDALLRSHLEVLEQALWISHLENDKKSQGYVFIRPMQTILRRDVNALFRTYVGLPEAQSYLDTTQPIFDLKIK